MSKLRIPLRARVPSAVRPTLPGLAASLLCACLCACGSSASPAAPPAPPADAPDIVLVSIDSLRADHLTCYGYPNPTSPTLDRLAAEGVRCASAISTTSWTLPAHAALFTGLYDSGHGVVDNGLALGPERVTLAEVLREHGWQTGGFYGGPYLHPTFGLGQGFDTYQSCMSALSDDSSDADVRQESRSAVGKSHADVTGPRTLQEVSRWLDGLKSGPMFLFVHFWDVHYDYIPPPEYARMFDPDYQGSVDGVNFMSNPAISKDTPLRDLQHVVALYDAEIRFTDDNLNKLLGELDRRGRMKNTIVVVTADHGEEFFDHGGKGHQRTLYDEVVHVPLVFHWTGHLGRERRLPDTLTQQVRTIDVMPTLLTLAGVTRQPAVNGRDLTPALIGQALEPAPALCELLVDQRQARALRTEDHKTFLLGNSGKRSTFDLRSDPRESRPLPDGHPAMATGLQLLESELGRARERAAGGAAKTVEVPAQVLERLRALGYAGETTPR